MQEFPVYLDDHPFQIYERIKAEKKNRMRTADVVFLPHYMVLRLKEEGMLSPYIAQDLSYFPKKFQDSKNTWFAMGVTFMTMAYNYAGVRRTSVLPRTLEDLVSRRWEGRLGMQSLVSSTVGNLGAQYIGNLRRIVGHDKWMHFLAGLKSSDVKTFDCIDHLIQGLLGGVIDIALTVYSLAYFRERIAKSPVRSFEAPEFPRMLTFTSVGLTKDAEDNDSAKLFLDFLTSPEAQRIIGTIPGISPARRGFKTEYDFEVKYSATSDFHPDNKDLRQLPEIIQSYVNLGLP